MKRVVRADDVVSLESCQSCDLSGSVVEGGEGRYLPATIISRLSEFNNLLPAALSSVCSSKCPMTSGL